MDFKLIENREPLFLHSLIDLKVNGEFADVTLVSDDQTQVKAHKIVLSSYSPVLRALLVNRPHSDTMLFLVGIKHEEMECILQFIYAGETNVPQSRINEFWKNMNFLGISTISREKFKLSFNRETDDFLKEDEVLRSAELKLKTDDNTNKYYSDCKENALKDIESPIICKEIVAVEESDNLTNAVSDELNTASERKIEKIEDQNIPKLDLSDRNIRTVKKSECPNLLLSKSKTEKQAKKITKYNLKREKKYCSWLLQNGKICGKKFKDRYSLNCHMKTHEHGVCPVCGENVLQRNLPRHINTKHGLQGSMGSDGVSKQDSEYECSSCSEKFKSSFQLHFHLYKKHGIENANTKIFKKFMCNICDRKCSSLRAKDMHISTHSTPTIPCQHCGKMFSNNYYLKLHIQNLHTPDEEKKIKCNICNKGFNTVVSYEGHVNMHKGVKPFVCEECGIHFQNDANRRAHMRKAHPATYKATTNPKQKAKAKMKCCYCLYETKKTYDLKRHIERKHNKQ